MRMEKTLTEKFTALVVPLTAQLQNLQENLNQVAQTTDMAMELGLANQEVSYHFQKHCDWATDKLQIS